MRVQSCWVSWLRLVRLGTDCRTRPLVFSFGAALPGMMRRGEVDPRGGPGLEGGVAVELGFVVRGEGVHRVGLLQEQGNGAPVHFGRGARAQLAEHEGRPG